MWSNLRSLWIVFLNLFKKKQTIEYPEEKPPEVCRAALADGYFDIPDTYVIPPLFYMNPQFL